MEGVPEISKQSYEQYVFFKQRLEFGIVPPLRVVYDSLEGFTVEAAADLPYHSLLCEYTGQVNFIVREAASSSNSLMDLLVTDDSRSLLVDAATHGNISCFFR